MINLLTNVAHGLHSAHDNEEAGAATRQNSVPSTHSQSAALPDDERAVLTAQGEDALRSYQAGKAHYAGEAARIARLPSDERAVVRGFGEAALRDYQTGKAKAEIAAARIASLPKDERAILLTQGEQGLRTYQTAKSRAALKKDERAVVDALGEQGLSDYRKGKSYAALPADDRAVLHTQGEQGLQDYQTGKSYASLPKDEQAVLHGAGEEGLHSYQTGKAIATLPADERAVLDARGVEGLRDYRTGKLQALLPGDERAVLHAAGEQGLKEYRAVKADAVLTDHDRAVLRAQKELQQEALFQQAFKGHSILAGSNFSPLHIADTVTDHVLPMKAAAKAAINGNFEDAFVLATTPVPGSPDAKLGLWDVEKDMAAGALKQAARTTLGPVFETADRANEMRKDNWQGALPEVGSVVNAPKDLYEGAQKIANGDVRGGVHQAAPAVLTLAGLVEGFAAAAKRRPATATSAEALEASQGAKPAATASGAGTLEMHPTMPNVMIESGIPGFDMDRLLQELERTPAGANIAEQIREGKLEMIVTSEPLADGSSGLSYKKEIHVQWGGSIEETASATIHEGAHYLDPHADPSGKHVSVSSREAIARAEEYEYRLTAKLPAFDATEVAYRDAFVQARRAGSSIPEARVAAERAMVQMLKTEPHYGLVEGGADQSRRVGRGTALSPGGYRTVVDARLLKSLRDKGFELERIPLKSPDSGGGRFQQHVSGTDHEWRVTSPSGVKADIDGIAMDNKGQFVALEAKATFVAEPGKSAHLVFYPKKVEQLSRQLAICLESKGRMRLEIVSNARSAAETYSNIASQQLARQLKKEFAEQVKAYVETSTDESVKRLKIEDIEKIVDENVTISEVGWGKIK